MGMYTELHYNAELVSDVPESVLAVLRYMLGMRNNAPELPDHPLFRTSRWHIMLTCDSYYFAADTHSTLRWDEIGDCWYLCVRSNLKNYDQEIERFIEWVDPYVEAGEGEFLGFYRYEESENPTVIRKAQDSAASGQEQER